MCSCVVLQGPTGEVQCAPRSRIVLEWALGNVGSSAWPKGTEVRLRTPAGELGSVVTELSAEVPSGESLELRLELSAPDGPAKVLQSLALVTKSGEIISSENLMVELVVASPAKASNRSDAAGSGERAHPLLGIRPGSHTRSVVRRLVHLQAAASEGSIDGPIPTVRTEDSEWIVVDAQATAGLLSKLPRAAMQGNIEFAVNGVKQKVQGGRFPLTMSLAEFLRYELGMCGTKIGCGEGGCGACTVLLCTSSSASEGDVRLANSCLRPLHAMAGAEVFTIEHLGSAQKPHPLQKLMVEKNGTQCGMCTPGMVMAIYGNQLKAEKTKSGLGETCIQGNLCRCTGYRPIYDVIHGYKPPVSVLSELLETPSTQMPPRQLAIYKNGDAHWIDCLDLKDVFAALKALQPDDHQYRLVVGNTGHAVGKYYVAHSEKVEEPKTFINIAHVPELLAESLAEDGSSITLGAACTLTRLIELLDAKCGEGSPSSQPLTAVVKHLRLVAHPQVRDVASWAGNLMTAKEHPDFASDICLLLTLLDSTLTLATAEEEKKVPILDFLAPEMSLASGQIVKSITIPLPSTSASCKTFKVMKRKMNTHAELNFGILLGFEDEKSIQIQTARVVVGNIGHGPKLAKHCMAKLSGSKLSSQTIEEALKDLALDVAAVSDPTVPDPGFLVGSKEYRRSLAHAVFYKGTLQILQDRLGESVLTPAERSAVSQAVRPPSSGVQRYTPGVSPLGQPQAKYQGLEQACGSAKYTADLPLLRGTVFGAPVVATSLGSVESIDASAALSMAGVVGFIAAEDVEKLGGKNVCQGMGTDYPVFAQGAIKHVGQFVGLVVAETFEAARQGARAVHVTYKAPDPELQPVLSLDAARASGQILQACEPIIIDSTAEQEDPPARPKATQGSFTLHGQKHIYLECQSSYVVPREDGGFTVNAATQWTDFLQKVVAMAINLPASKVAIENTRIGGAYGGKVFYAGPTATAATFAARKFNRPVMLMLGRNEDSLSLGGRNPVDAKWTCTYNADTGKVSQLTQDSYAHGGFDKMGAMVCTGLNCYNIPKATLRNHQVIESKALNSQMRAPGEFEASMVMESIIEAVVRDSGAADPTKVQEANLDDGVRPCWAKMLEQAEYAQKREAVQTFNQANKYQKQGLWCMGTTYSIHAVEWLERCGLQVHDDGSVLLQHSGLEMGQGMDTKAVQACTQGLRAIAADFDEALVSVVLPKDGKFSQGCLGTFGSATSETVVSAVLEACKKMASALSKYSGKGKSWHDVAKAAVHDSGGKPISVTGEHHGEIVHPGSPTTTAYPVYAAAAAHVQVDVLSGEVEVLSFDMVYDAGNSMNPSVDIGQIEGCIVQALGICLMEEEVFSDKDGRLVNNGTWDYKIPSGLDIPQKLNVTLLPRPSGDMSPAGILGSKATGEPAYLASGATFFAVKDAVVAARQDPDSSHYKAGGWFQLDAPASGERIIEACGLKAPGWPRA